MGTRIILRIVAFLGVAGLACGQLLDTPHGQVEFIGLKSWSAKLVYDKLVQIDSRNPFCMAGLEKMGAPASSVYKELQKERIFSLIIVVEPQFADRVKRRPVPLEELSFPDRWSDVMELLNRNFDDYMAALQLYASFLSGKPDTVLQDLGLDAATIKKIWAAMVKLNDARDKELAAWIILNDKNVRHRIAAASVLANFPQVDSTWWMLMEAMRYDDMAGNAAKGTLNTLSPAFSRDVDWSLAIPSIRALIEGTNPSHFLTTVRVLTQTKISPRLAVPLLSNGGSLLIDFLKASRDQERAPVRRFLASLAGKDFGSDPAAWALWMASLGKSG